MYVKGTIGNELTYTPENDSHSGHVLSTYMDADWVEDLNEWCSVIGYCVYIGNNLIFWSSKK